MLRLRDGDGGRYQRIVRTVKQVAPFFRDFVLEPELAPDRDYSLGELWEKNMLGGRPQPERS